MSTLNNYLIQLQKLTQTNLDLLTAVNGALKGDATSTKVEINGKSYDIPSFVSLENKVNSLQETINNIVYAPNTGEALINMTGNSRIIELRGYTHTPNSLTLDIPSEFGVEENTIFKDFLTPQPYVKFDISTIPNDITSVNIKKIIPKTEKMLSFFISSTAGTNSTCKYATILRHIKTVNAIKGVDYIEYDTVKKLPIRKNIGQGEYIVKTVIKDEIDDALIEHITVQLDNSMVLPTGQENTMTYVRFDGTLETYLVEGDRLVTYDDGAKVEIESVDYENCQIKFKVLYGEYLNLIGTDTYLDMDASYSSVSNISKLKFFSPVNFNSDKYINVPMEEDQFVFVAIAPLNDRMNIQSGWGNGVLINTDNLKRSLSNNTMQTFKSYYKESVKNIGDCLSELVNMMPGELTKFSKTEFETLTGIQPQSSHIVANVIQINKHLNDSPHIKSIRELHSQKIAAQQEVNKIQNEINECINKISKIPLSDTTGMRASLNNELKTLNESKNTYWETLNSTITEINTIYNTNAVPSADAKYHVRGFFKLDEFNKYLTDNGFGNVVDKIRGIEVQYRYKNQNPEDVINAQTNITSIGGYTYSEWEIMNSFVNEKIPTYEDGYKFRFKADNSNANEPSFNQIDIPISRGELVEMRLRVIYDYGYPFIKTHSAWSPLQTYEYPIVSQTELSINDIVTENKNDYAANNLNNMLKNNGITAHVEDSILDQELTYFHKADNIASGFYTEERRIIPLIDKLKSMNDTLTQIYDEVMGSSGNLPTVSVNVGQSVYNIVPSKNNSVLTEAYNHFTENGEENGYTITDGIVSAALTFNITNDSKSVIKLYSVFPGSKSSYLKNITNYKYTLEEYALPDDKTSLIPQGVFIFSKNSAYQDHNTSYSGMYALEQMQNQWITFRIKSPWDGKEYYSSSGTTNSDAMPLTTAGYVLASDKTGSLIYPYSMIQDEFVMGDSNHAYITLNPGETKSFQVFFEYKIKEDDETSKTIAFDLRTSLYNDPITYEVTVNAKYALTAQDRLMVNVAKNQYNKYKTAATK